MKHNNSYFDISARDCYFMFLKAGIFAILTLGILFPYEYHKCIAKVINNTYIDGRKCTFTGRVRDIYIIVIIGIVLIVAIVMLEYWLSTVITGENWLKWLHRGAAVLIAGVISLVAKSMIKKWRYVNTHFLDNDSDESSMLKVDIVRCCEISVFGWLINTFTVCILLPYMIYLTIDYITNRAVIDGEGLVFTGLRRTIIKIYFPLFIGTILTFGLMGPYLTYRVIEWQTENTHLVSSGDYTGRKKTWLERVLNDKVSNIEESVKGKLEEKKQGVIERKELKKKNREIKKQQKQENKK